MKYPTSTIRRIATANARSMGTGLRLTIKKIEEHVLQGMPPLHFYSMFESAITDAAATCGIATITPRLIDNPNFMAHLEGALVAYIEDHIDHHLPHR